MKDCRPITHTHTCTHAHTNIYIYIYIYIWVKVMVIFRQPYFNFICSHHPWRWVAVVSWRNYVILAIDQWSSLVQHLVQHIVDPMLGSSTKLHIQHAASHDFKCLTCRCKEKNGSNIPQNSNCMGTYHPSQRPSK